LKRNSGPHRYAAAPVVESAVQTGERQVTVGRITGIFGVKGWVRVFSYTDPPKNILQYAPWLIGEPVAVPYRVTDGSMHGRGVIAHLQGVDDRDLARRLIGSSIRIPRAQFRDPGRGEYYWFDLVGLEVIDENGSSLGRVEDLLETGANDVMVIAGDRRRLVPFILQTVVKSVDLDKGIITVSWHPDD
jgi:16S rRNA processing protein RimM